MVAVAILKAIHELHVHISGERNKATRQETFPTPPLDCEVLNNRTIKLGLDYLNLSFLRESSISSTNPPQSIWVPGPLHSDQPVITEPPSECFWSRWRKLSHVPPVTFVRKTDPAQQLKPPGEQNVSVQKEVYFLPGDNFLALEITIWQPLKLPLQNNPHWRGIKINHKGKPAKWTVPERLRDLRCGKARCSPAKSLHLAVSYLSN